MPSKVQANFWVDDLQVRNINVKTYESSDRGNSGVSGKFYISGTLNIQPKGYIWAMQQPFRIGMQVDEEPRSGTIVFNALTKRGIDQMVELAISDYSLDSKIVGMLGRLDYVPYGERRRAHMMERVASTSTVMSAVRRLLKNPPSEDWSYEIFVRDPDGEKEVLRVDGDDEGQFSLSLSDSRSYTGWRQPLSVVRPLMRDVRHIKDALRYENLEVVDWDYTGSNVDTKRASDTAAVQRKAERLFAKHDIEYEVYEGYSGRGMYGNNSPLAYSLPDSYDNPRSDIGKALQRLGFYVDNLGMGWIYYLR